MWRCHGHTGILWSFFKKLPYLALVPGPCTARLVPGESSQAAAVGKAHVLSLSLACFHESLMHLRSVPGSELAQVSLHRTKARMHRRRGWSQSCLLQPRFSLPGTEQYGPDKRNDLWLHPPRR